MKKKIVFTFIGILLLLNVFSWKEVFNLVEAKGLEVTFLDVGQGDSAFLETSGVRNILIDGGPDFTLLRKLSEIMPFWDKQIDILILTHPERDHFAGLIEVLKRYKVGYVFWTGVKRDTSEYKEWIKVLANAEKLNNTKVVTDISNKEIRVGKVLIDLIYPFDNIEGKDSNNDTSLVSRVILNNNSFLFTGDISSKVEENIIYKGIAIQSDVLKVAHHGSKYSTGDNFLDKVDSKIAVISVGRDNTYGHPTNEVLQRLKNSGIQVLRTDLNGDIKIETDGNNLNINKQF